MNIMPATARSPCNLRINELFNPSKNIKCGVSYFKKQLVRFNSIQLALCAYNAGPHRIVMYGGCPPFKETQYYKKAILADYNRGNACRKAQDIIIDNF
jgi:soluble lytic murein transglycosylase-like protein